MSRFERAAVAVLGRLLPAGFRERQRAEWTADLLMLADGPASARRRYLAAAAWTLPALRHAVRRGGIAGPATPMPAPGALAALAQVLVIGLAWPVTAWLLMMPFTYLLFDVPGRIARSGGLVDPKDLWPTEGPLLVLLPVVIVAHLGTWAVILGGPFLLGWTGAAGLLLRAARWRHGRAHRVALTAAGLCCLGLAVAVGLAWSYGISYPDSPDRGATLAVLGAVAVVLSLAGQRLNGRLRTALLVLGMVAVAVPVVHSTAAGTAMVQWFMD